MGDGDFGGGCGEDGGGGDSPKVGHLKWWWPGICHANNREWEGAKRGASTSRCRQMQADASSCRQVQAGTNSCRETSRGAARHRQVLAEAGRRAKTHL